VYRPYLSLSFLLSLAGLAYPSLAMATRRAGARRMQRLAFCSAASYVRSGARRGGFINRDLVSAFSSSPASHPVPCLEELKSSNTPRATHILAHYHSTSCSPPFPKPASQPSLSHSHATNPPLLSSPGPSRQILASLDQARLARQVRPHPSHSGTCRPRSTAGFARSPHSAGFCRGKKALEL